MRQLVVKVGHVPCCAAYRVNPIVQEIPFPMDLSYTEPYTGPASTGLLLSFEEKLRERREGGPFSSLKFFFVFFTF